MKLSIALAIHNFTKSIENADDINTILEEKGYTERAVMTDQFEVLTFDAASLAFTFNIVCYDNCMNKFKVRMRIDRSCNWDDVSVY